MSAGAKAMGVAVRLAPALVLTVALALAAPAAAIPAVPTSSDAPDLIDPDCEPEKAKEADPSLVEEPDGVCPPAEQPDGQGDAGPAPDPGPPGEPRAPPDPSPASGPPAAADQPFGETNAPPAATAPGGPRLPILAPEQTGRRRAPASEAPRRQGRPGARKDDGGSGPAPRAERRRATERQQPRRRRGGTPRRRTEKLPTAPGIRFPTPALEPLPDPLPRARRLDPDFARTLVRVSDRWDVPWQVMLAVLRAGGNDGPDPASRGRLRSLARRLVALGARKSTRRAVRRLARTTAFSAQLEPPLLTVRRSRFVQRVVALAHYNRAVGLRGLVKGLNRVRARLARLVVESRRLVIYPGGEADIKSGLTDVRVLVLLRYLASRYREVTVTSLTTGHSFLTASGNVSAHSYGRAVDIATLGGVSILGNQEPGGLTERALRRIMLLPEELEPNELISLFALGGPSFALADHADHIHVGY
jgi:hypothetical protein